MNFTELLAKHDLDESEYTSRTERNHSMCINDFRSQCPMRDWIGAGFVLDWSTNRIRWHTANIEWRNLHS